MPRIRPAACLACALGGLALGGLQPARAQFNDYSITPITPSAQTQATIDFSGPYYYYILKNEVAFPDQFFLEVRNLVVTPTPDWFAQVCLRQVCFPESTTITLQGFASDTIGVNVVPFSDGVGTFDFHLNSVGDPSLQSDFTGLKLFAGTAAVGVDETPASAVAALTLAQNVPNPARGGTRIGFALPGPAHVQISVFDVAGRLVRMLTDRTMETGTHSVSWDALDRAGRPVPAGVYYYRLSTPDGARTKRMTLVR